MKCPQCGAWNRASFPTCQTCGFVLGSADDHQLPEWRKKLRDDRLPNQYIRMDADGEPETNPDSRDLLANEMAELKTRKADGREQQRRLRSEGAARGASPSGRNVQTFTSGAEGFWFFSESPVKSSGNRVQVRGQGFLHEMENDLPIDDSTLEEPSYDPKWSSPDVTSTWQMPRIATSKLTGRLPTRRHRLKKFFTFLMVLVFIATAGAAGFFGYQYYINRPVDEEEDEGYAIVTASIMDDLAAHTILIPGTDGSQIYISELRTSYVVAGGYATIEIADHTMYDNETITTDTKTVTLTPYLKTTAGRQTPMGKINYEISIPNSPITLTQPDSLYYEVSTTMYTVKLAVRPGSTVLINGSDYSDAVDSETGEMSVNLTVQPIGDNVFNIAVRSQYCRENNMILTLYREPQEIPLDLAADTYGSTNNKTMLVSCTTLPGVDVDVLTNHTDLNITDIDSTGMFSFYAVFDKIGYNTITITASSPGKKTSTLNYQVYYLPSADVYTRKAWALSESGYAELLSNIAVRTANTQVYLVTGTVQYVVSTKPQMVVINTSADGKSQPVLIENNTSKTLEVGQYYRIYADAYGTYNSMPWLQGRYVYLN